MNNEILRAKGLTVEYSIGNAKLRAVDDVSLVIHEGETVSIVGESGCGKSTLAKALLGLVPLESGGLFLEGCSVNLETEKGRRKVYEKVQMIFQNPFAALNPRKKVKTILMEPLSVRGIETKPERVKRVKEMLELVGLDESAGEKYPTHFSGGQRQRIGIARAIIGKPRLIICDEPVAALDVSVQAQVINLLMEVQRKTGVAYLFISHDLSVVEHIGMSNIVMYMGGVVARGSTGSFWDDPLHPYVVALKDAAPSLEARKGGRRQGQPLRGEVPSGLSRMKGCKFASRCPYVLDICREEVPQPRQAGVNEWVACHRVEIDSRGRVTTPWGARRG